MLKQLKQRKEGFTIIEVLIVLAIAGLIMLIVFLAVPALQRNQRNSQRTSEAARVAASVSECLANRNGVVASCTVANLNYGTLNQFQGVAIGGAAYSQTNVQIVFNTGCLADGSAVGGVSGGPRSFAVTYQLEPAINRCVAS